MKVKVIRFGYGALGFIFSVLGLYTFFKPAIILTEPEADSSHTDYTIHLKEALIHYGQELGLSFVLIGLVLIWMFFNVSKTKYLNYVFLFSFILLGSIHWAEYFEGHREIISPLINSLPACVFAIVVWLYQEK